MLMGSLFILVALMYSTSYAISSYAIVEPEYLQSNVTPTIGFYAQALEPTPYLNSTVEAVASSPTAVLEKKEDAQNIVLLPVVGDRRNSEQDGEAVPARAIDVDEMIQSQESDNLTADVDVPVLPTSTPTPTPTQEILETEAIEVPQPEGGEPENIAESPPDDEQDEREQDQERM